MRTAPRPPFLRALLAALALVAGLVVAALPTSASAAVTQITDGSVTWGVKESWRRYIGTGSEAGDGATITGYEPNGNVPLAFSFPVDSGSYDSETRTTVVKLKGYVHFRAWYGQVKPDQWALDTKFSDLELTIGPDAQELRGTHTGYSRSDPGGELHVDEDVVLARVDLTGATTTFGPPTTTWADLPATAGSGFSIYGEGTPVDPITLTYQGAGAMPDLTETFDQPGMPVLEAGDVTKFRSDVSISYGGARDVEASGDGAYLYTFEIPDAETDFLRINAVRTSDMSTVATFDQPIGAILPGRSGSRMFRSTIDARTVDGVDTLYYVTANDGADRTETTVRSLTFDRASTSFADDSTELGLLPSGTPGYPPNLGNLALDAERGRLAILTGQAEDFSVGDLYWLDRNGDSWTVKHDAVEIEPVGRYAGTVQLSGLVANDRPVVQDVMAFFSDGSLAIATSDTRAYTEDYSTEVGLEALHVEIAADSVSTAPIAGTDMPSHPVFALYYGWRSAAAGPDGSVWLHGDGASLEDVARVDVVDGVPVARPIFKGPDVYAEYGWEVSQLGGTMTYEPTTGRSWAVDEGDTKGQFVKIISPEGDAVQAAYSVQDWAGYQYGPRRLRAGADGALYAPVKVDGVFGIQKIASRGVAPAVTTQPDDVAVELDADEAERAVSFTIAADDGDVQWQAKSPGATRFADVAGATGDTLPVDATPTTDGTVYRAKVTNAAGKVVSEEATLDVTYPARFLVQPRDVTTRPGSSASFNADVIADPGLTSTAWQRRTDGFWTTIAEDDDNFVVGDTALTVKETNVAQSGAQVRLKAVSPLGTTYSKPATLTVEPVVTEPGTISGAVLEWTGSEEMQKAPPAGGSSYFSAGVSDGAEGTYRASSGDASIVHVDGDERTAATWGTRAAMVDADPDTAQTVVLEDGEGERAADGTVTIGWDAAWTVNFYGGLLPFTITDPTLTIDPDGSGTLRGDLSGYASSQANPGQKDPVDPVEDVVISTFADATFSPDGFTIDVDYAGVEVDVPSGATAQNRTAQGWGAWPQQFVDFHGVTGLTSYWYSSGGAADPYKAGSPIVVRSLEVVDGEPVVTAPVIGTEPSSTRATHGRAATFTVGAVGDDLTYQWQRKIGSSWIDLPDEQEASLSFARVTTADHGASFRVKVTNAGGSVTSRTVQLVVVPATTWTSVAVNRTTQKYKAKASKRAVVTVRIANANRVAPQGTVTLFRGKTKITTIAVNGRSTLTYRLPAKLPKGKQAISAVFTPKDPRAQAYARSNTRTVRVTK